MRYVLFAFTLPWTITVGWGWVFLMRAIGAATDLRWDGTFLLTAVWKDWVTASRKWPWSKHPVPLWRFSTVLGRGIIYQPGRRAPVGKTPTVTQLHEEVHVRQIEDLMLLSFIIGLIVGAWTGHWFLGLLLWWSGGLWQFPNFITAAMRGGDPYRDSEHEKSAYSQTSHL